MYLPMLFFFLFPALVMYMISGIICNRLQCIELSHVLEHPWHGSPRVGFPALVITTDLGCGEFKYSQLSNPLNRTEMPPLKGIKVIELAGLAPGMSPPQHSKTLLNHHLRSIRRSPTSRLWRLSSTHRQTFSRKRRPIDQKQNLNRAGSPRC